MQIISRIWSCFILTSDRRAEDSADELGTWLNLIWLLNLNNVVEDEVIVALAIVESWTSVVTRHSVVVVVRILLGLLS